MANCYINRDIIKNYLLQCFFAFEVVLAAKSRKNSGLDIFLKCLV